MASMIAGAREDGMLGIRSACLDGDVTRCTPQRQRSGF